MKLFQKLRFAKFLADLPNGMDRRFWEIMAIKNKQQQAEAYEAWESQVKLVCQGRIHGDMIRMFAKESRRYR
jgi:hypothetical protein